MQPYPFVLVSPATRGLSLALAQHYLKTTNLPVFATYRKGTPATVSRDILASLKVDKKRLTILKLDLDQEASIADAAESLAHSLPQNTTPYLHTAFFSAGVLHPERQARDLDLDKIRETFRINCIAPLLLIKYFARFLPGAHAPVPADHVSKWVHVSARVGSVSDNKLGGWYSYRASKAALNQVVKTFDLELQHKHKKAICVGVHPGTVKTDLSKDFWSGVDDGKLFEPEFAAERLGDVVSKLEREDRGRVWDWKGEEVKP